MIPINAFVANIIGVVCTCEMPINCCSCGVFILHMDKSGHAVFPISVMLFLKFNKIFNEILLNHSLNSSLIGWYGAVLVFLILDMSHIFCDFEIILNLKRCVI